MSFFNFGIQKHINRAFFLQLPRKDQDDFLQYLYDQGYSVKDISKEFDIPVSTLYSRINSHRSRTELSTMQP